MKRKQILFVAEHDGPFQTLSALAKKTPNSVDVAFALGKSLAEKNRNISLTPEGFSPDAVFLGTSETFNLPSIEDRYGIAATKSGIPVFVIEDFPLNFRPHPKIKVEGLFVEFPESRDRYASRGLSEDKIYEFGNPRYSSLPIVEPLPKSKQLSKSKTVFWAGQPDNGVSFQTLQRLLPYFSKNKIGIYFRAHPRDTFYSKGVYDDELKKGNVIYHDVTKEISGLPSLMSADLVLTQFSTMAVESLFRGIPSVFVLFPDLGGKFMRQIKGDAWLPWVNKGMALEINKEADIEVVLNRAFNDENARRSMINTALQSHEYNIESVRKIWETVEHLVVNFQAKKSI